MVITNSCILNERYAVQSVLGEVGPFDVTYLAWDIKEEQEIVLHEYYPLQYAKRAADGQTLEVHNPKLFEYGLGAYTAEAHRLIDIEHPHILNYKDNFKENGTIYSVADYVPGASAYGYMTQQGGALLEEEAVSILGSVLEGLDTCHRKNLFHGGIWPKSIHLTPEGRPILMGFCQARFQLARHCDKIDQVYLPGFTAPEQAEKDVQPGPWWDIFGSAATLFYFLTGYQLNYQRTNCSEEDIRSALYRENSFSSDMRMVLEKALAFDHSKRPASMNAFHDMLLGAIKEEILLSAHNNGHRNAESKYPSSVSKTENSGWTQKPAKVKSHLTIDAIDVPSKESEHTPKDTSDSPLEPTQSMQNKHNASITPHRTGTDQSVTNTNIVPKDAQQHALLIEEESAQRNVDKQPVQPEDKDVTQMLARMVKWQQALIAFILGFVFLVLIVVIGIFAGPQLLQLLDQPALSAASPPTRNDLPDIVTPDSPLPQTAAALLGDSSDSSVNPTLIDSIYASILSQMDSLEGMNFLSMPSALRLEQTENTPQEAPVEHVEEDQSDQSQVEISYAAVDGDSDTEENEPFDSDVQEADSQANSQTDSLSALPQTSVQEEAALITQADSLASMSTDSSQFFSSPDDDTERIEEILLKREFQLYRAMGDSLLIQGLQDMALQWYRAALEKHPEDVYVSDQIQMLEEAEARATAEIDSLNIRIAESSDADGIFFSPDLLPVLKDREQVYRRITFPVACLRQTDGGRVIAKIVVDEQGQASNPSIVKGLHAACDEEVLRVLSTAEFEPGIFNGEPVKAWYAFSVMFKEES